MPDSQTYKGSEYSQSSFLGGMNLLGDDSRLQPNQYRAGFNLTNRYDVLDPVLSSILDTAAPAGVKQELITFGNFVILFVAGLAYYRFYTDTGWTKIAGFKMSIDAPRFWTVEIPVSTTNYIRYAASGTVANTADPSGVIELSNVAGAAQGNIPGLLVQDNINQPQFIFINGSTGKPAVATTQDFANWSITFTDATNTVIQPNGDKREYVPIGNCMTFDDGILFIVSQDFSKIYRSVLGRPLDFVVNVSNVLVTGAPFTQFGGGDANTTSYDVGVGGITCITQMAGKGIFVSASNANFLVSKNTSPGAPKIFGEYTFTRDFLFNSNCLSDRVIFDTLGDTRFIDLTGVRSFNAIEQVQNEGRNTPFTAAIQGAFGPDVNPIIQDASKTAAILQNNYELYAMNTIFGSVIAKYDTLNKCWTSFDKDQTNGKAIKIFAKIELSVQRLYAVTEDDKLYTLYIGPEQSTASFRSVGICANILQGDNNIRMANPKNEIKLSNTRVVLNKITEDCDCSFTPYVNNRLAKSEQTKTITYEAPSEISTDPLRLPDVNTLLMNLLYATPDCQQGWKVFGVFSWTGGSFTQLSMELQDCKPMNPLNSQELAS